MIPDSFDDIRPYRDPEIPAAMERIASNPTFRLISDFLFPERRVEDVRKDLAGVRTTHDFQHIFMKPAIGSIVEKTTGGVTFDGLDTLPADGRYLFISNHRDIALDAAILTWAMACRDIETPEITFGANLMQGEFVIDFGKSNKMFRVERPSTASSVKEFLLGSRRLSEYIRETITVRRQSVWIAQRNGRTKDGNDTTDQGLVKMLGMSLPDDKVEALASLNIVPMSISYEWEPCDILKVLELYETSRRAYIKKPGEDLASIIQGIIQPKGRVHISLCNPIGRDELLSLDHLVNSRYNREVASLIDRRIRGAYRMWPNNYIAHDIRFGRHSYAHLYTKEEKAAFEDHLSELSKYDSYDVEQLRDILLSIYATPVDNAPSTI